MKTILLIAMLNGTCAQLSHNEESERREGRGLEHRRGIRSLTVTAKLNPRMLPNHEYPIPQREPLLRIIRNRRIHRSMSNRDACRRRDYAANMLIRLVPHLDAKGEVAWDIMQVGIGQLPQQFIDAEVRFRASAPKTLRRLAQLLKHAQRVLLTVRLVHKNIMRTRLVEVKSVLSHVWPFHRQSDLG